MTTTWPENGNAAVSGRRSDATLAGLTRDANWTLPDFDLRAFGRAAAAAAREHRSVVVQLPKYAGRPPATLVLHPSTKVGYVRDGLLSSNFAIVDDRPARALRGPAAPIPATIYDAALMIAGMGTATPDGLAPSDWGRVSEDTQWSAPNFNPLAFGTAYADAHQQIKSVVVQLVQNGAPVTLVVCPRAGVARIRTDLVGVYVDYEIINDVPPQLSWWPAPTTGSHAIPTPIYQALVTGGFA